MGELADSTYAPTPTGTNASSGEKTTSSSSDALRSEARGMSFAEGEALLRPAGVDCRETPALSSSSPQLYQQSTIDWIASLSEQIISASQRHGVPPGAVVGAIADEKDVYGALDLAQDAVIDQLSHHALALDRAVGVDHKLLNAFENDLGPGNINLETATQMVESGQLEIDGVSAENPDYTKIVDYLLTDDGTIEAAAAVIAQAMALFEDVLPKLCLEDQEAILMEHYKQGPTFHARFRENQAQNPDHLPSPGDDGLQYLANRDRLISALGLE